ncbi:MAG: hypothetical protein WD354_01095 [Acidimicrobiia bacterium]
MTTGSTLDFSLDDLIRDVRYACLLGPATPNHEVLDPYGFISQPAIVRRLGAWIASLLRDEAVRLIGVGASALPVALAVGLDLNMPVALFEKAHLHGEVSPGNGVAIVADITRTGDSAIKTIDAIKDAGAETIQIFVVWDRAQGALDRLHAFDTSVHVLIEDRAR